MVVVDSSALIPLAWIGRLELIGTAFDEIHTTSHVEDEVLTEGKPGTAALASFLDEVAIHEPATNAEAVANLDGIATADASVILLADDRSEILLANDKGLVEVARSHDVECWWITTLFLSLTKRGTLDADESTDVLYDLVDRGMNLHPKVYAQVERKFHEIGEH